MKKYILIILIICSSKSFASIKENIISNLENIDNISFNFEQNINGKIETRGLYYKVSKKNIL